jgi:hypothetical protein
MALRWAVRNSGVEEEWGCTWDGKNTKIKPGKGNSEV